MVPGVPPNSAWDLGWVQSTHPILAKTDSGPDRSDPCGSSQVNHSTAVASLLWPDRANICVVHAGDAPAVRG